MTTPPDNPHIWEEERFKDVQSPPDHALGHHAADRHPDGGARQIPGRASPSTARRYTQPFEVMKDPAIAASVEDLQTLDDDADADPRRHHARPPTMVNKMEVWRKQIEDQREGERRASRRSSSR